MFEKNEAEGWRCEHNLPLDEQVSVHLSDGERQLVHAELGAVL